MKKYSTIIIRSSSHTDARRRAFYNETLSDRRAKSSIVYSIEQGIHICRISEKGFGETRLINGCKDNDSHISWVNCS